MPKETDKKKDFDIFSLLEDSKKLSESQRAEILKSLKVKEFFRDGSISVNDRTCQGLECELCIKACPTQALYWQDGKIGIIKDLCVYCGSCVLCCIVDDCIKITRTREDGEVEKFSTPRGVVLLFNNINFKRRCFRIKSLFPTPETYIKRYGK